MSDIFLSYKREDKAKAQIIAGAFKQNGYSVWWDMVIPPGLTWDEVIEKELTAAKCVVVLWSKESVNSYWVRTEAHEGNKRGILVPVMIEDVVPPLAFRLIQAAKLIDWDGIVDNSEFSLLLESVAGILERPTSVEIERHRLDEEKNIEKEKKERKKSKTKEGETGKENIKEEEQKQSQIEIEEKETFTNSIGMKFTLIPTGKFIMGSNEFDYEKPAHEVTIGSPFYLGIYQVTQKEWEAVMGNNPSHFQGRSSVINRCCTNHINLF